MTAVIKISENGTLSAIQVGPAELVAALNAATSAWGWLGGLSGVQRLFSYVRKKSGTKTIDTLVKRMRIEPITCQVLTSYGIVRLDDLDTRHAFGGTFETQLLGQTICALAHECGGRQAVHLFMQCLAPKLFPGEEEMAGLREALHAQLNDNHEKILNEGAGRSLTQRFNNAIWASNLPFCVMNPAKDKRPAYEGRKLESYMVGGLLQWLGQEKVKIYHTRSALVLRVAVCLREIGYMVGELTCWSGDGDEPQISRGVILVLGGTSPTDTMMLSENSPYCETVFFHHYRFTTIGSVFLNGLPHVDERHHPEPFQTIFDKVLRWVTENLSFDWKVVHKDANVGLQSVPRWTKHPEKPSSEARRLASFHFTNSGDHLAHCYSYVGIANERHIDAVLLSMQGANKGKPLTKEVANFRVLTASILFAVSSLLGGKDFSKLQHVTSVDLSFSAFGWMSVALELLDEGLIDSLPLGRAIDIVAGVHAGAIPVRSPQSAIENYSIGYRNGIYGVLPSLLFAMKPIPEALGLRCVDQFYGTIPVHPDGYIRSIGSARLSYDTSTQTPPANTYSTQAWIGPLEVVAPDVPLHLSIERSAEDIYPNTSLAGRVNGQLVGYVTIQDVIEALAENLEVKSIDSTTHAGNRNFFNVQPSFWAEKWSIKPHIQGYQTHVSAGSDPCWAIFLAGQAASFGVCMALELPEWSNALVTDTTSVIVSYKEKDIGENQHDIANSKH
ncbi:uncharacterized protein LY89DRAFT_717331 [Mollisia scopiformis]|uniref:Uncharacterized protein n=1 Tax=Mollisia scopiformis TaxID=149040 RepID=A0A194XF82_MOLSC|nr:uncharacterized protein LY89DRAFT_717331 [Mollisia scopiformis]KUJ18794.1 hypothetical protein LY89DRAFT_717331 [Mollisia scopiformis]